MDYTTFVYFVLLHCSINALPYETDSHESGEITVSFDDDDKHDIFLDEQEQKTIIDNLEKILKEEEIEKLLGEQQKEEKQGKESELESEQQKEGKEYDLERKVITDKPRPAKYEVTENVIDVPDDRTRGPIVTNYSITRPLNTPAAPTSTTEVSENDKNNNEGDKRPASGGSDVNKVEEGSGKKNYISILHVKAEIDNTDKHNNDKIESSNSDFGSPHVSGIKEYFNGIKKGIVNGFNSIINLQHRTEATHAPEEPTGPFGFLNKITRKSSQFAQSIHNHIFGDQEDF
ncbi:FK506-binding protein 5-like isoform X1 [Bicyclus anynana]|uniref:FK506-binding protein 5-like isoform X1 n=1 Tax=Bicyclus anynana TaxID=110368 RepID=A0A6J1NAC2_BICAN|nr:FK506-binding protein 5-like isoform X1 [Bicyclus anynana]